MNKEAENYWGAWKSDSIERRSSHRHIRIIKYTDGSIRVFGSIESCSPEDFEKICVELAEMYRSL